jgi:hypothetical protein
VWEPSPRVFAGIKEGDWVEIAPELKSVLSNLYLKTPIPSEEPVHVHVGLELLVKEADETTGA